MKKNSNIIYKKRNYILGLKELLNWLFNPIKNRENLESIITKYEFDLSLFKRLVSYSYNTPHIVWYLNKYLNNSTIFDSFNLVDLIYSYSYLLSIHHKNQPKKLFYLKSDDLADKNKSKIKELLSNYFSKIFDKYYNNNELNFFYNLFQLGAITVEQINQIDNHLNSGTNTLELSETVHYHQTTKPQCLDITRELPKRIIEFCNKIKNQISTRQICKQCELYGKPSVILDTNLEEPGEVDIFFIGLNPGKDEVIIGKPFVGKSGMFLREKISKLPNNITWAITNVILCHTRNEKDIKKPDLVIENCRDLLAQIASSFPSKVYVPLGAKAAKALGLKENIGQISGKKFHTNHYTIIPIIHPSSAINYGHVEKFNQDFQTIYELFSDNKKPANKALAIEDKEENLTLFDIKEVNNKILKIFIDKNGNKKYVTEDNIFSFYVKLGNWNNCEQITDHVDYEVIIPGNMKSTIVRQIKQILNEAKEIV